jgi:hypothetical protein
VVVLQNCVNLLEVVPGSYNDPCHDGNQFMHIEVEEVADIIEEGEQEDPLAVIKSEKGVSFMSVCICCLATVFPAFIVFKPGDLLLFRARMMYFIYSVYGSFPFCSPSLSSLLPTFLSSLCYDISSSIFSIPLKYMAYLLRLSAYFKVCCLLYLCKNQS